jgi:hypothetical protein
MDEARRRLLKGVTGAVGGWASLQSGIVNGKADPLPANNTRQNVRDKLWIWGHPPGSHNGRFGIQGTSRMTPAEGAFYLNVPNLVLAEFPDPKEPCRSLPEPALYDQYAISFRPLRQVVWSIVGAGGVIPNGLHLAQQLAQKFPNIVGMMLDDFFRKTMDGGEVGLFTPGEVSFIHDRPEVNGRKLELWITLQYTDLQYDLSDYLTRVDVVTYWTINAKDLENLEDGFAQAERIAPRARKLLGCYFWDFGGHSPIPMRLFQKQCKLGLEWLRSKRIDGMLFLASCDCDLGLESVEWTRNWIGEVGDTEL